MIVEVLGPLVIAVVLARLGYWGWRHADELPAGALSTADRRQRAGVLRRGSAACQVLAACFVLVAAITVL